MKYFIDSNPVSEKVFWSRLQSLISVSQKIRLLDGMKVKVAESIYWIETEKL